ncbi:malate dehydrogenase (quinone) [Elizabethkingia meningoseptica]|uniref:malate dehydrogenase (quinone) n=1 Tax=Elizabethkingia meningoseptica TaxID=238 RepID=UPI00136571A7|nr:malate dehydrogenase (quinone) [Elizabethkingia meningoseptica]MCL1677198.1 malate dehydrogenase (quinone) [Elizabethkingia meningoseptica]MCL1686177.1 malate dehydrogenase (quinone) [Elizabethkingia meningoseptica]MDE5488100.1 malate dehydrogenase (quinone) [Elizabethkingia meningoseptica]MDE5491737.1 malate dehydrogenase (quinone) [Elizabethkingia meningoseptica]MVW91110.1 malate dehydrogenase (quinone) [Elizabethkingia meningoseptica]
MNPKPKYDVVLIGGGIMSATLGTMLHEFDPNLKIALFERLKDVARESSSAWNNAGTGHSAFCELNYTTEKKDGSIDISKAEKIAEQFEISKQFWAYLVSKGYIDSPKEFINSCPHMSLVFGEKDIEFLRKRHQTMTKSHLFEGMEFSDDHDKLREWVPLIMRSRNASEKLAATRMAMGTDVDFGALTKKLVKHLEAAPNVEVFRYHEVKDIDDNDGKWRMKIKDRLNNHPVEVEADFVFIGAGGYALPLLDSSDIKESKGYGGFPVSGQWLVTKDPELIAMHHAKVYTQATVDAPPMSVPHLDLRIIDGEKALLFGPFAGFSTKFLKNGSYLDLPESINFKNIRSLFGAWWHNLSLTRYLIRQVTMSKDQRIAHLRDFIKDANADKWELMLAGQRVQIIKKDEAEGGKLEFGTEVVTNKRGTIASLLGASPGASTAAFAMINILEKCFGDKLQKEWREKLLEMVPTYGRKLKDSGELTDRVRNYTKEKLELEY